MMTATILRKSLVTPMMALALIFTVASATNLASVPQAEAASVVKKVKIGGKFVGKGFAALEKAGRKAQKKRGIVGKAGGILKNSGKAGKNVTSKFNKGVSKASNAGNKLVRKTKIGRKADNAVRKAGKWQNKQINKAFRKCRGTACNLGKEAVKFVAPL